MTAMTSVRRLAAGTAVAALAILWLRPGEAPATSNGRSPPATREPLRSPSPPAVVTLLPIAGEAAKLNTAGTGASDDIALLGLLFSHYRRHHDGNPTGDNPDISAALRGSNPKALGYLPDQGPFLDGEGRLIDRWGTPYFFHAMAGDRMEIRSAGPDLEFWTGDDLTDHPETIREKPGAGTPPMQRPAP